MHIENLYNSEETIRKHKDAFTNSPHTTKKHACKAKVIFDDLREKSITEKNDHWSTLYHYEIKEDERLIVSGKEIIKKLREHLTSLQDNRCCYCRKWLYNIAYASPIEHILARKHYPQFSLEYTNFAVVCFDCNQIKSAADWECLDKDKEEYPKPEAFIKSFHPTYHRYDGHINFIRFETNQVAYTAYIGKTEQGKKLCIDLLSIVSEREVLRSKNPNIIDDLNNIQTISDEMAEDQKEAINKCVTEIYKRLYNQV